MEICADNLESVANAVEAGAARIELCSALTNGGLTPTLGLMKAVKAMVNRGTKVHVLVRLRGGDFCYSESEIKVMAFDAAHLVNEGEADGVVFGCLDTNGDVDVVGCRAFMKYLRENCSKNVSTTFHRAFDVARNPMEAAAQIVELGFDRILTSGQQASAVEGKELLRDLATKYKLKILPGGGISETNLEELQSFLHPFVDEFHASAKTKKASSMKFQNEKCKMGVDSEDYTVYVASRQRVAAMVTILKLRK